MFRIHFVSAAFLAVAAATPVNAQERVPAVLDNLKPHEVVEAVTSEAKVLGLAAGQRVWLVIKTHSCRIVGKQEAPPLQP